MKTMFGIISFLTLGFIASIARACEMGSCYDLYPSPQNQFILSENFPSTYPANSYWEVAVHLQGKCVNMVAVMMDTVGGSDYLTLKQDGVHAFTYSGPDVFATPYESDPGTDILTVEFESGYRSPNINTPPQGFEIRVTFMECPTTEAPTTVPPTTPAATPPPANPSTTPGLFADSYRCGVDNFVFESPDPKFIISPQYPHPYPNGVNCVVTIESDQTCISVRAIEFETEASYDKVRFTFEGNPVCHPCSGFQCALCETSRPGLLSLRFESDFSERRAGFVFEVNFVSCPEPSTTPTYSTTTTPEFETATATQVASTGTTPVEGTTVTEEPNGSSSPEPTVTVPQSVPTGTPPVEGTTIAEEPNECACRGEAFFRNIRDRLDYLESALYDLGAPER